VDEAEIAAVASQYFNRHEVANMRRAVARVSSRATAVPKRVPSGRATQRLDHGKPASDGTDETVAFLDIKVPLGLSGLGKPDHGCSAIIK
jgi:hypothetical protein